MAHNLRSEFERSLGFPLDNFQREAFDALDEDQSVLVAAPTGSGKTLIGEYALTKAHAAHEKAFYTTPLKALSNQKFRDLSERFGSKDVGLLTGDNSINGDAPIVVMTTEVLRNMIYANSPTLEGLRYVVLDEVHYLQNPYRGPVWEEVIVHVQSTVKLVCLSATVSNAEEFADWLQSVRGTTAVIIEETRPVEIEHHYAVGERRTDDVLLLPTFVPNAVGQLRPNPEAAKLDAQAARYPRRGGARSRLLTPYRMDVVDVLAERDFLPAIFFVFSRAGCDQAVQQCLAAGGRLTNKDERREIRRIAEQHTDALSDTDLEALHYSEWLEGLEHGFAAHHAGLVPPMKETAEEAFAAGLIKVVFATETLALGINMPARSVVIEKLSKFSGDGHEFLTPGEYTQLTGRAGRRGIDTRGHAIVCWSPFVPFDQVASLASRRTYALTSSFRPTYNMASNLVHRYSPNEAHRLLNLSFAQYQADQAVVGLTRELEIHRARLLEEQEQLRTAAPELESYRRLVAELEEERQKEEGPAEAAISALRPGDVLLTKRFGRVVVVQRNFAKSPARVLCISEHRDAIRLGSAEFTRPLRPVSFLDLPAPVIPKNSKYRRIVAEKLRLIEIRESVVEENERIQELLHQIAAHPITQVQDQETLLNAGESADQLQRDVSRLERRMQARSKSLGRQFDRVLRVLEAWGYLNDWELTDSGRTLARLYAEMDLVLAESLSSGLFEELQPAELAAVVSVFTYERRGPEGTGPPPMSWPTKRMSKRFSEIHRIWKDLRGSEEDAGLPETRPPDPGFVTAAYEWVNGADLADLLDEDEDMTGGDFVRQIRQLTDLLHQVAVVAPHEEVRKTAQAAAQACRRGVAVAAFEAGG